MCVGCEVRRYEAVEHHPPGNQSLAMRHHSQGVSSTYLVPDNQVSCEGAIIGENVDDLGIGELVAGHHILAIHLGADHVVAHICVHMICKVQHGSTLHSDTQILQMGFLLLGLHHAKRVLGV